MDEWLTAGKVELSDSRACLQQLKNALVWTAGPVISSNKSSPWKDEGFVVIS